MATELFTAPWYPWYVNDVLTSEAVDLMSLAEEGAYRRALDKAWKKGSIPAAAQDVAKMIGKRCSIKIAEAVMEMFEPMDGQPGRLVNIRLEEVRQEQCLKYKKKSASGKQGADKRWQTDGDANGDAIKVPLAHAWHSDSDTEDSPKKEESSEKPQTASAPKTKRGTRLSDEFFLTADMRVWGHENKPSVDLVLETKKFCNYFRSAPGQKGTKLNWRMTWENWILNAKGTNGTHQQHITVNGNKPTSASRIADHANIINQYPTEAELRDRQGAG